MRGYVLAHHVISTCTDRKGSFIELKFSEKYDLFFADLGIIQKD
jgi:hypothetical protein